MRTVAVALGAFLMQVCVRVPGAVVPAHLNELSPAARGTFPAPATAGQSDRGGQSAVAIFHRGVGGRKLQHRLAIIATCAALLIATLMWLGPEAQNVDMGRSAPVSE